MHKEVTFPSGCGVVFVCRLALKPTPGVTIITYWFICSSILHCVFIRGYKKHTVLSYMYSLAFFSGCHPFPDQRLWTDSFSKSGKTTGYSIHEKQNNTISFGQVNSASLLASGFPSWCCFHLMTLPGMCLWVKRLKRLQVKSAFT